MSPWRFTIGTVLVVLGGLLMLDQVGYLDAGVVIGNWWPLAIVLLGALYLIGQPRARLGPAIVIFIGLALLIGELELVPGGVWGLFWPLVLIGIGAWILLERAGSHRRYVNDQDAVDQFVAFGGLDLASQSPHFHGGSLNALFGGIKLDLREAELPPEGASLDALAAFGGVEVLVPHDWRVNLSGLPLFGGLENRTLQNGHLPADAPTLDVRGTALFGGVEVKS